MSDDSRARLEASDTIDVEGHLDVEQEWGLGAGGLGHRQRISGPESTVLEIIDSDNRDILRWGVFVLTFVPITTTLIAKLPEIITALSDAFG